MRKEQYDALEHVAVFDRFKLDVETLHDLSDRTLLYGYTSDRRDHHLYLLDREICLVVGDVVVRDLSDIRRMVPTKRLYPEACDAEFCELLLFLNTNLPFTAWCDKRAEQRGAGPFYGETHEDLKRACQS